MCSVKNNNKHTLSEESAKGNLRQQGIVKYLDGNRKNEHYLQKKCNNLTFIQVFVNDIKFEHIV